MGLKRIRDKYWLLTCTLALTTLCISRSVWKHISDVNVNSSGLGFFLVSQTLQNVTLGDKNCTVGVPCWMEGDEMWTQENRTETINLEKCE